jgi:hypothetical protein
VAVGLASGDRRYVANRQERVMHQGQKRVVFYSEQHELTPSSEKLIAQLTKGAQAQRDAPKFASS